MTNTDENQGLFRDDQIRYVKLGNIYIRRFASGSDEYYKWRYISQEYFNEQKEFELNIVVPLPGELIADIITARILGKIANPIREYDR